MKAVPFEGHNVILAKDQPQYQQLPVLHEKDREGQPMTACFQLEQYEIDQLNKTGLLWRPPSGRSANHSNQSE